MPYGSILALNLLCCTAPRPLLVYRFIALKSSQAQFGPAEAEKEEQKQDKEQQQKQ